MSQPSLPIEWTPTARRSLARPPEKIATAAVEFIYSALAENPQRVGKPLRKELAGLHSARRGSYRVVYRITDVVTIIAIDHRAEIYHAH